MMKNTSIILLASCCVASALENGGCLGGDIPWGRPAFYDHSKVIPPYKDESQINFDDKHRQLMVSRLEQFSKMTETNAPPSKEYKFDAFPMNWAYYGSSGRALTFWKLYLNTRVTDHAKAALYLALAKEYIDGALSRMRYDRDDAVGFLEGNPGVYAIASVIYDCAGEVTYA